jgi:hypothetical protein
LATSCSIGEPLTNRTLDDASSALRIVNAEPDSVAVAKIELGEITVKMLLADVLINAVDSAFQDREISLCIVVWASPRTYSS